MKKIVFMGSDPIVLPMLNHLLMNGGDEYELVAVYSQPDRPSGRGKKMSPNAVSEWALDRDVKLMRPEKPSDEDVAFLLNNEVDLVLVMAYGHIISQKFLDTPPLGCLNFHGSLLPKYRGASPVVGAIVSGDKETGVTLMKMVAKMDAGPVLDKEVVSVGAEDTSESVRLKLADACVPLIERNMEQILGGRAVFFEQNESIVSYTRKIKKEDGRINFNMPGGSILDRIRALSPWPGSFFEYKGDVIKVSDCSVRPGNITAEVGRVVGLREDVFQVIAGDGLKLCIGSMQKPGGKRVAASDFLRGYPIPEGIVLSSESTDILVSDKPFPYVKKKS